MAACLHRLTCFKPSCHTSKRTCETIKSMSSGKSDKCLKAMSEFYSMVYGDKWESLLHCLQMKKSFCAMMNDMIPESAFIAEELKNIGAAELDLKYENKCQSNGILERPKKKLKLLDMKNEERDFDHPRVHQNGSNKMGYFLLDLASLVPVIALDIHPNDFVLDMCSSPGGKTLAIAMHLSDKGQLISNEFDSNRRKRLHKIVDEYLPKTTSKLIKITNFNGKCFGTIEPNTFDKVLIDAPCSSDRHLIQDEFRHSGWSLKKSHDFAGLQRQLLLSGIDTTKIGGTIVYSTCTLSPFENDDVISWALAEAHVKVVDFMHELNQDEFCISKTTNHGVLVIPSIKRNWGPMYTCKLVKES